MARRYVLVDDYTGEELPSDVKPTALTVGRTSYNLYLSDESLTKLYDAIEPFTHEAERADTVPQAAPASPGTRRRRTPDEIAEAERVKEARAQQRVEIQEWATKANAKGSEFTVPGDRGRISGDLLEAFYASRKKAERLF